MRRDDWLSLEGPWQFAIDADAEWRSPDDVSWDREIVVPFSPETAASGIADDGLYRACWYRRAIYEYPQAEGDPYYPIPRPENGEMYRKYKLLADRTANVHFVGRLATYKYYNMDQVVAQALTLFAKLTGARRSEAAEMVTAG